jgi:hypothetical protein
LTKLPKPHKLKSPPETRSGPKTIDEAGVICPNLLFKESVMEKQQSSSKDKNPCNKPRREAAPSAKETPEEMIRSLQGVFCKGRYRSWAFAQGGKTE